MLDKPMGVYGGDHLRADGDWDELVWVWTRTHVPEGCRVEIVDGLVTVTPLATVSHHRVADRVHRLLCRGASESRGVYQRLAVAVPSRLGLYMPDLVIVPEDVPCDEEGDFIDAAAAHLVMEITSRSTARQDRTVKPAAYATAGIPLYLLVDRWAPDGPATTLYGEPKGDVYRPLATAKFGEPIKLPAPFDLVIDTSEFPVD
ncbi:Uma2 family endonuclease [Streptomyces sp. 16-176A]